VGLVDSVMFVCCTTIIGTTFGGQSIERTTTIILPAAESRPPHAAVAPRVLFGGFVQTPRARNVLLRVERGCCESSVVEESVVVARPQNRMESKCQNMHASAWRVGTTTTRTIERRGFSFLEKLDQSSHGDDDDDDHDDIAWQRALVVVVVRGKITPYGLSTNSNCCRSSRRDFVNETWKIDPPAMRDDGNDYYENTTTTTLTTFTAGSLVLLSHIP
jgi:hypothetical protein